MCRLTLGRFPVWAFLCGRILAGISLLWQLARGPADEARAEDARGGAGGMAVERRELAGELTSGGGATARGARGRTTRDSRSRARGTEDKSASLLTNHQPTRRRCERKKYKKNDQRQRALSVRVNPNFYGSSYQTKRVGPSL